MNVKASCVIDASVIIKLFLHKELSEVVQQVVDDGQLETANSTALIVPEVLFVECAHILLSNVWFNGYPPQTATQAMRYLCARALPTTSTADLMKKPYPSPASTTSRRMTPSTWRWRCSTAAPLVDGRYTVGTTMAGKPR